MSAAGKLVHKLSHEEKAQLTSDIAVVLFTHTGQQPPEACRKAEDFVKALEAKQLPAPSALPFMPMPWQGAEKL